MLHKLIFFSLLLSLLSACQTHLPMVSDSISCDEKLESIELADIDYLLYANTMVDSLTQDRTVEKETSVSRMKLFLYPVNNNSNESIDMTSINRAIKNRIIRSGKFILVNELEAGHFQLSGAFEEINQPSNNCSGKYQRFSLKLIDTRTNTTLWSEEKRFN